MRQAGSLYGGVGIGPLIRASKMSNSAEPSLMSYLQYSLSTPEYSSRTPGVHEPFLDVVRTVQSAPDKSAAVGRVGRGYSRRGPFIRSAVRTGSGQEGTRAA